MYLNFIHKIQQLALCQRFMESAQLNPIFGTIKSSQYQCIIHKVIQYSTNNHDQKELIIKIYLRNMLLLIQVF